jgi:hypothetical protein
MEDTHFICSNMRHVHFTVQWDDIEKFQYVCEVSGVGRDHERETLQSFIITIGVNGQQL